METADVWFESEFVSSGVTRIWEPAAHRFFRANCFHVSGRAADLVIDFGLGLRSLRQYLKLDPAKPLIAVATHAHVDHVGSFFEFDERLGHQAESKAFAEMGDEYTLANYFRSEPEAVSALPEPSWNLSNYQLVRAPLTRLVGDGDTVDLGNRKFTILHLPGHSPGSIALFDELDGTAFTGDAIYDGFLVDDVPGSDKQQYASTMQKLRELPVAEAHGGHGLRMSRLSVRAIAEGYLRGLG